MEYFLVSRTDLMGRTIYETMQRFEQRLTAKFKQTQSPPFETIFQFLHLMKRSRLGALNVQRGFGVLF